ncbi:2TM domain-containing protein [Litorisediminicola beolgyonensis]|uniref:2TM domain-containing protein n=1 Tax=Litorisediminicola beolgyonensis TaxID=1173614 RepID=A0ABW3ZN13_9RHOB
MTGRSAYDRARGRAEGKYRFYIHAVVFIAVITLLVIFDALASPGTGWVIWPILGWGLALALHGARVFLFADKDTIVDRMTEQELRNRGGGRGETRR